METHATDLSIDDIFLLNGSHKDVSDGLCAMEAVSFLAGEKHSDSPDCACPVLAAMVRRLNDRWDDVQRQALKPFLGRLIGTRDKAKMMPRAYLAADWATRDSLPAWLDFIGMPDEAARLRLLPPVTNSDTARGASEASRRARESVRAKYPADAADAADAAAYAYAAAAYAAAAYDAAAYDAADAAAATAYAYAAYDAAAYDAAAAAAATAADAADAAAYAYAAAAYAAADAAVDADAAAAYAYAADAGADAVDAADAAAYAADADQSKREAFIETRNASVLELLGKMIDA